MRRCRRSGWSCARSSGLRSQLARTLSPCGRRGPRAAVWLPTQVLWFVALVAQLVKNNAVGNAHLILVVLPRGAEKREVTSPVTLVVSAFAPVSDVRRTLTPELRRGMWEKNLPEGFGPT